MFFIIYKRLYQFQVLSLFVLIILIHNTISSILIISHITYKIFFKFYVFCFIYLR